MCDKRYFLCVSKKQFFEVIDHLKKFTDFREVCNNDCDLYYAVIGDTPGLVGFSEVVKHE